ncbi:hypothetical protein C5C49_02755 [Rathayibacter sp. AY1E2]|nr:hypothetical protein C5C49_02755 [Rathayibacter sp. AY1E2]
MRAGLGRESADAVVVGGGEAVPEEVAELGRADHLVTDAPPPPELEEALRDRGVEIVLPAGAAARER